MYSPSAPPQTYSPSQLNYSPTSPVYYPTSPSFSYRYDEHENIVGTNSATASSTTYSPSYCPTSPSYSGLPQPTTSPIYSLASPIHDFPLHVPEVIHTPQPQRVSKLITNPKYTTRVITHPSRQKNRNRYQCQTKYVDIRDCLRVQTMYYERTIRMFVKKYPSVYISNSISVTEIPQCTLPLIGSESKSNYLVPIYNKQAVCRLQRPQLLYDICLHATLSRTTHVKLVGGMNQSLLFIGTVDDLSKKFTRDNPLPIFALSQGLELVLDNVDSDLVTENLSITYRVAVAFGQELIQQWRNDESITLIHQCNADRIRFYKNNVYIESTTTN